jgi:AraC family transcriptional regulator, transcriptional activator of pobA
MSYHHFCRFFKRITGKTFMQYLNFVRVREAEKLILTTDKNISEIAQDVGFAGVSGFNKAFKKEKHLSPIAYKKQHGVSNCR